MGGSVKMRRHMKPQDMTACVKWPLYIQLQRKKAVLSRRLKVPPALNQFKHVAAKPEAQKLFALLEKYRPESKVARTEKLEKEAKDREAGKAATPEKKQPKYLATGIDEVTKHIESKTAKLVILANDVDPIELVCWGPTLCRKMNVPYCIVKDKARLGALVHRKTATSMCLVNVKKEDQGTLDALIKSFAPDFIENQDARRRWGGGETN